MRSGQEHQIMSQHWRGNPHRQDNISRQLTLQDFISCISSSMMTRIYLLVALVFYCVSNSELSEPWVRYLNQAKKCSINRLRKILKTDLCKNFMKSDCYIRIKNWNLWESSSLCNTCMYVLHYEIFTSDIIIDFAEKNNTLFKGILEIFKNTYKEISRIMKKETSMSHLCWNHQFFQSDQNSLLCETSWPIP